MDQYSISDSSSQWDFFVKAAFVVALTSTLLGIYMIPGELVIKGYFLISSLFLVFSTITLSKTVRDGHESKRLHNKISEARTSKMIQELDAK
ncbi:MAG: YiaA/YiaB family inner membrane protein [Gammaproteobacteria bacterium]|nr:YiaA/YiaB family inner membrane protein [Gammaproteobacteria bacterium]